ncbi:hypothetical protein ACQKTA_11630 (plasmid) [Enterococcus sp. 22-H-5-01]|uniref:hypothetical protein n=1 Tax=Enterococcus sp. 22-H-5-01 TaxID=3418555 RepID=UPI003CFC0A8E
MKKVALVTFKDSAATYEAFSQVKKIAKSNTLEIRQAAVIEKNAKGTNFTMQDSVDYESGDRVVKTSLIGMLVGILAGPLGILCGWIIGDIAGLSTNYLKNKKTVTVFDKIAGELKEEQLGLLLYIDETDPALLDTMIVEKFDGSIERFDYTDVKEDVSTAQKHLEK